MAGLKLYVGTFTRTEPYLEATNGEGLYTMDSDSRTGGLTQGSCLRGPENPAFLTVETIQHFATADPVDLPQLDKQGGRS